MTNCNFRSNSRIGNTSKMEENDRTIRVKLVFFYKVSVIGLAISVEIYFLRTEN